MGVERLDHPAVQFSGHQIPEHRQHGDLNDASQDLTVTVLVHAVHLYLAGHGRWQRIEVRHPGDGHRLAGPDRPSYRAGRQRLLTGHRHSHRDPGSLVQVRAAAGLLGHGGHQPGHEVRHHHLDAVDRGDDRLLDHDVHLHVDVQRIVGPDLGPEPVLERGDDATTVGVVLRIGRGEQHHVQRQAHPVATDLHVAFLEHVQQADLDPLGQVGQFVDGEQAPVGAGYQAVVDGQLVGQIAALGHPDGIDLADEVGDGGVRRGQLLAVPVVTVYPVHWRVVAQLGHQVPTVARYRRVRIVVDLGPGHDRHPLIQQARQAADEARLGLAALAQEDHVVSGQQGILQLGQHGVVVAEDLGEQWLTSPDAGHRVAAQLGGHRNRFPAHGPQFTDGLWPGHGGTIVSAPGSGSCRA